MFGTRNRRSAKPRRTMRDAVATRRGFGLTLVLALSLCVAAVADAGAQELSDIPAAFVDVGIGARAMGAGGAVAAANLGPASLFWNPAGIAPTHGATAFAVTHGEQMGLVPYSAASASHALGSGWTFGAALIHSGDEVLTETTVLVGAARPVLDAPWCPGRTIALGAGARLRRASFGDNESVDGQVTGSASGYGVDFGALVPLTQQVTLGVSGRDLVNSLAWESSASGSYSENVPAQLTAGLRAAPREGVALEVDVEKSLSPDNPDRVLAGLELSLWGVADLRGGYRRALGAGELEEYTLGGGASVDAGALALRVDVAYVFGQLDDTLRFSLGVEL